MDASSLGRRNEAGADDHVVLVQDGRLPARDAVRGPVELEAETTALPATEAGALGDR